MKKERKTAADFQICDVIEIVNKDHIENSNFIENGECFIVIGVRRKTARCEGYIEIIDNDGEALLIFESEFTGIKWIA